MSKETSKETASVVIRYDVFEKTGDLPLDEEWLLQKAREAMANSHSPYSNFTVGAAVRLEDGTIMAGSNQENASYGVTICAERTVLAFAGAQGHMKDVRKLAVIGTGREVETTAPVMPCGACRQFIKEVEDMGGQPITIVTSGATGPIFRFQGIDSLLPLGFGPKDLGLAPSEMK